MNAKELNIIAEQYRNVKYERVFDPAQMHYSYAEYIANIQGRKVSLGIPSFDKALGMIRPSQVVTIIGATNVGKTTVAMNIALANATIGRDKLVVFFNLEIDQNEIYERLLQMEYDLYTYEVEKAFQINDKHLLEKFEQVGHKYKNFISVIGRVSVEDIVPFTKAIEETYHKEAGMIVVDHLGLVKNEKYTDEYARTTDNAMKLKEIAINLQIPVLNLSQTSRADVKNNDKGLNLYSGKGSGEVENSSQIVITIDKLDKDKALGQNVPYDLIEQVEKQEVYLLHAKIQKKKQGNYADTVLIQNRKNLKITEMGQQSQTEFEPF